MSKPNRERRHDRLARAPAWMALCSICVGLMLSSGCAQSITSRSSPFEIGSARLKQTFSRARKPVEDHRRSQSSPDSVRRADPGNATPMLYQPESPVPMAESSSRANAEPQSPWTQAHSPFVSNAYQPPRTASPMATSPGSGEYPVSPDAPQPSAYEQQVAFQEQDLRVRFGDQPAWQSEGQPVAQAAYYAQPQDQNYQPPYQAQPQTANYPYPPQYPNYPFPPQDANYPYPILDGLPYAPLQYPAVELPSQSTYIKRTPAPVPYDNNPAMNPYPPPAQDDWNNQVAPGMPAADAMYPEDPETSQTPLNMPSSDTGQLDPNLYVNPTASYGNVMGSGSGHLQNGLGLRGSMLRRADKMATEISIELTMQIDMLRQQNKKLNADLKDRDKQLEDEQLVAKKTKQQLLESQRQGESLREEVARLRVQVEDLSKENVVIQQNADKALREIEKQLDTMLISTMSKTQPPATGSPGN